MSIKQLFFGLLWLLILNSCGKENVKVPTGFILAGNAGNVNNINFSPVKLIETSKVSLINSSGAVIDSVTSDFEYFDLNNSRSTDICFTSIYGYPNKNSKTILLNTIGYSGFSFSFCAKPFNANDTISASQSWVTFHNINDSVILSLSDSSKNDWSTPKYFGYRFTEDNKLTYYYGWIKLAIDDYNQLKIYSYSCSK